MTDLCDGCFMILVTIREGANAGLQYCPNCRYATGEIKPDPKTPPVLRANTVHYDNEGDVCGRCGAVKSRGTCGCWRCGENECV